MSGTRALKCTGEYRHQWPKTHETMCCASGKVAAPAADETETLKQSFAEWKKFRPVREFPSSEQLGASLWKVWEEEKKGEQRLEEMVHHIRHPTNIHHYQHLTRQHWLELRFEAIYWLGRPVYNELGNKTNQCV